MDTGTLQSDDVPLHPVCPGRFGTFIIFLNRRLPGAYKLRGIRKHRLLSAAAHMNGKCYGRACTLCSRIRDSCNGNGSFLYARHIIVGVGELVILAVHPTGHFYFSVALLGPGDQGLGRLLRGINDRQGRLLPYLDRQLIFSGFQFFNGMFPVKSHIVSCGNKVISILHRCGDRYRSRIMADDSILISTPPLSYCFIAAAPLYVMDIACICRSDGQGRIQYILLKSLIVIAVSKGIIQPVQREGFRKIQLHAFYRDICRFHMDRVRFPLAVCYYQIAFSGFGKFNIRTAVVDRNLHPVIALNLIIRSGKADKFICPLVFSGNCKFYGRAAFQCPVAFVLYSLTIDIHLKLLYLIGDGLQLKTEQDKIIGTGQIGRLGAL